MKEVLTMKKALGKKKTLQNGTLVAYSCDCISVCKSLASCNCITDQTLASSNSTTSFGKIVASTMSGTTWG